MPIPIREIVPQYVAHFRELKRVKYERREAAVSAGGFAAEILGLPQEQVLVILNTRKDAMELLSALGNEPNVYHLSTLLCGGHRKAVLEEIKLRLDPKHPSRCA